MRYSPRIALLAFSASALALGACSSANDSTATDAVPSGEIAVDQESAGPFNDADVQFAQSMIPHHLEAIEMAELALSPTSEANNEVQALASQIRGAQDPEVEQMTNLLSSWGQPLEMTGDEMAAMEATMSAEDMAGLASLRGAKFDVAWAEAMIVHHEGAVSMAENVKTSGLNPEVGVLAEAIIAGQQAEIDQMKVFIGS